MFDLIDDLSTEVWGDKGTPPEDLTQIGKKHCVKYARIRVISDRISSSNDRIEDSLLIPENTGEDSVHIQENTEKTQEKTMFQTNQSSEQCLLCVNEKLAIVLHKR